MKKSGLRGSLLLLAGIILAGLVSGCGSSASGQDNKAATTGTSKPVNAANNTSKTVTQQTPQTSSSWIIDQRAEYLGTGFLPDSRSYSYTLTVKNSPPAPSRFNFCRRSAVLIWYEKLPEIYCPAVGGRRAGSRRRRLWLGGSRDNRSAGFPGSELSAADQQWP